MIALIRTPFIIAATILAAAMPALANPAPANCPARSVTTTSLPDNPFGVTVPWVKTSAPGIVVYAALTNGLDAATQHRLAQRAQSTGTGSLVLFVIDVSTPTVFPKLRGNARTGIFTWPFTLHDKVVEEDGRRVYPLALTLNGGCWNISAQLNGAATPALPLLVP